MELEVVARAGRGFVDAHALLATRCHNNYDTVHFDGLVTREMARLLLRSVVASPRDHSLPPAHQLAQLREFTSLDPDVDREHMSGFLARSMVGAEWSSIEGLATARSMLARRNNTLHSHWAWFGGSVTAQNRIVSDVQWNLKKRGLVTTVSNFGVPASDPEYLAYCLNNVVGGQDRLRNFDVIVWEYAENDYTSGSSLDSLVAATLRLPHQPVVLMYLHCGPRTVQRNQGRGCSHSTHRGIARKHGIVAIDLEPWILSINASDYPTYFYDGVHPTRAGAGFMGQLIIRAVHQGLRTLHVHESPHEMRASQGTSTDDIDGLSEIRPASVMSASGRSPLTRHRDNLTDMPMIRHCWTTLGSEGQRNLLPMQPAPGWTFVSEALEKYPRGKNGWQNGMLAYPRTNQTQRGQAERASLSCIDFRVEECSLELVVFYLSTNTNSLFGRANISVYSIQPGGLRHQPALSNVTFVAGNPNASKVSIGLTVAAQRKMLLPPQKAGKQGSGTWAIHVCPMHGLFRVIAIGC